MQPFLHAHQLTRYYGRKAGIKQISLQIRKGEVLALLGTNGAGKSTTIRTLAGIQKPGYGSVKIDGQEILRNPKKYQHLIGYLPDRPALFGSMRVADFLCACAGIRGLARSWALQRTEYVIERCDLGSVRARSIQNLSKGFQQRVALAQAIIHQPPLLLLDEPTTGLDPSQIIHLRGLIAEYRQTAAILLSTHQLTEVEQMADYVQMLSDGKTVFESSLQQLQKQQPLHLRFSSPFDSTLLHRIEGVQSVCIVNEREALLETDDRNDIVTRIIKAAQLHHWEIQEIYRQHSSLEKLFISKTTTH